MSGQGSKVDPGRPAFGPVGQIPDLSGGQLVTDRRRQRIGLGLVQGQQARADLEQVALRPDAPEGQARLGPCRERDPEPGRQVVQELGQGLEAGSIDQSMDIVEDDQGRPAPAMELEREPRDRRRKDPSPGGHDRRHDGAVDRLDPVEGRGEVRQEDGRVVVVVVEREPGHGSRLSCCPVGKEEGLPVPRRGHDRDDRRRRLGRQQADEADPLDDPGARRRGHKLGFHQRDRRQEARTVGLLARRFRGPASGIVVGDRHRTLVRSDDPESGRQHPSMRSTGRSSTRLEEGPERREQAPHEPPDPGDAPRPEIAARVLPRAGASVRAPGRAGGRIPAVVR